MTNNIKQFLVKESNIDMLVHIYRNNSETYVSKIATQIDLSRQSVQNKVNTMHDLELLSKEDEAGTQFLSVTDRGEELAQEFEKLNRVFREVEQQ